MPLYDYKCDECDEVFEVSKKLSELDVQEKCPNCDSIDTKRHFSCTSGQRIVSGTGTVLKTPDVWKDILGKVKRNNPFNNMD